MFAGIVLSAAVHIYTYTAVVSFSGHTYVYMVCTQAAEQSAPLRAKTRFFAPERGQST